MTKKHFIALADAIREHNKYADPDGFTTSPEFNRGQLEVLAKFCQSQNSNFNRERWLAYIRGECGPNGGEVKISRQYGKPIMTPAEYDKSFAQGDPITKLP